MNQTLLLQLGVPILQALLPTLGTLLGSLGAWLLWRLLGLIKNQQLRADAQAAVAFAEQKLTGNDAKLAYVQAFLKVRAGKYLSDQDINHLIEAAVLALKQPQTSSGSTSSSTPSA